MKEWPSDGDAVRLADLVNPLRVVADHLYKLKRLPLVDVPYNGFTIGAEELVGSFSPEQRLAATSLQYEDEEQRRDAMRVLLSIAVQLGIEQGRRLEHNSRTGACYE